jgi:hypothetical protein
MSPDSPDKPEQPRLDELISLAEAAEISGLTGGHIRLLVRNGEMWGKKLGRNWFTTIKAVNDYLARNLRRGPRPHKAAPA